MLKNIIKLIFILIFIIFVTSCFFLGKTRPADGIYHVDMRFVSNIKGKFEVREMDEDDYNPDYPIKLGEQYGGLPYLTSVMFTPIKDKTMFQFGLGDFFFGTAKCNIKSGKPILDYINKFHFDGLCLGNRDFDLGLDNLFHIIKESDVEIITTNINFKNPPENLLKYKVVEKNGLKIGVISLISPNIWRVINQEIHYHIVLKKAYEKEVTDSIKILHDQEKVDLIVALGHFIEGDKKLFLPDGIDILVNGDNEWEIDKRIKNTTVFCPKVVYPYAIASITFDYNINSKKLSNIQYKDIFLTKSNIDKKSSFVTETQDLIADINDDLADILMKKIGFLRNNIPKGKRSDYESPAGMFITKLLKEKTGSDIGVINKGAIKRGFKKGDVYYQDILDYIPFDNKLVKTFIPGKILRQIIEQSFSSNKGLYFFGVQIFVTKDNQVKKIFINNSLLKDNFEYQVGTIEFLSNGGDEYRGFVDRNVILSKYSVHDILKEFFMDHPDYKFNFFKQIIVQ